MTGAHTTMTAIEEVARSLERDLEVKGWDRPATVYLVRGTLDDPWLQQVIEVEGGVYDTLSQLPPIPSKAIGMALATEAWLRSPDPEEIEGLQAQLRTLGIPEDQHERILTEFYNTLTSVVPIRHQPGAYEIRQVLVALRDGGIAIVMRKRGEVEPETMSPDDMAELEGRIIDELRRITQS